MADPFRLTAEDQTKLRAMAPDLKAAADTIAKLKQIGIDVTEQEARVQQAQQIRDGFLQHFSNPIIQR